MQLGGFYSHYYLPLGVFFLFVWYLLLSDYSPEISASPWFSRYASVGAAKTRRVKLHHPIPTLMDEAKRMYHRKLDGQSKTLVQAVTEYKKRYDRDPPRGFGDWWAFAKQQNFTMMDEFDSLVADLEPFWSLSPEELRRRASQMGTIPYVDIVRVARGRVYATKVKRPGGVDRPTSERATHFMMMLKPFESLLPNMDFPISTKSEGRVIVPWEHITHPNITLQDSSGGIKSMLGKPFSEDWRGDGSVWDAFRRSCPPDSPARRLFGSLRPQAHAIQQPQNLLETTESSETLSPTSLNLVGLDHSPDFCNEPWGRYFQGHFFSDWRTMPALYPIFSPAKAPGFNDIVIPSHYYYGSTKRYTYGIDPVNMITKETDNFEIDWEMKKNHIFWRGASTGGGSSPPGFLHQYQRHRLVRMASQPTLHNTTVVFPESSASSSSAFITTTVSTEALNKEIFDIAFTMAIGCTQYKEGGCDEMRLDHRFANAAFLTDHWKYKYLIDVDGMGYSAHFLAFMASESAVMKSTVYREFFSDWIQPWLHYIPVSQSYAELYNIHAYFSGPSPSTINATRSVIRNFTAPILPPDPTSSTTWPHEGDRRLRQIARAGRQWKKTMTRREDIEVYVYRLCIEWARLWADDREAAIFKI